MKITATTLALIAALGIAACSDADAPVEAADTGETTVITNEVPVAVPSEETPNDGSSLTIDGNDVDATISEDGVKADIKVD